MPRAFYVLLTQGSTSMRGGWTRYAAPVMAAAYVYFSSINPVVAKDDDTLSSATVMDMAAPSADRHSISTPLLDAHAPQWSYENDLLPTSLPLMIETLDGRQISQPHQAFGYLSGDQNANVNIRQVVVDVVGADDVDNVIQMATQFTEIGDENLVLVLAPANETVRRQLSSVADGQSVMLMDRPVAPDQNLDLALFDTGFQKVAAAWSPESTRVHLRWSADIKVTFTQTHLRNLSSFTRPFLIKLLEDLFKPGGLAMPTHTNIRQRLDAVAAMLTNA